MAGIAALLLSCGAQQRVDDAGAANPRDAGPTDAGLRDAGTVDAGALDAGALDAGALDAGALDAGALDAGAVDAGEPATDAGFEACVSESDCLGGGLGNECSSPHEARSCLDGLCRRECAAPRTCSIDPQTGCTTCGSTTVCQSPDACIGGVSAAGSKTITSATCVSWPDGGTVTGSTLFFVRDPSGCSASFSLTDGGAPEGSVTVFADLSTAGTFPALGGGCAWSQLGGPPFGRWFVSCPRCEFVLQ